jgi:integrase
VIYKYNSFLKPHISLFLEQQEKVVSLSTYAHMKGILQHFDHYVAEQGYDNCNFTETHVLQWMKTIEGRDKTVHFYVSCLRSFFIFLGGYGFRPFLPCCPKVSDDYIAYEFTDEEINMIISIADNYTLCMHPMSPERPHSKRKYDRIPFELPMFLRILFGCGLRREEAVSLLLRDVDFRNNALIIRKTKSDEYRVVPMDPSLVDIISRYCIAMGLGADPDAFIFPGTDFSNPVPGRIFMNHFNRVLAEAGIVPAGRKKHERGPCIHCLRHAFAHRSFRKGAKEGWAINDQIPWLSVYLGHKSLRETEKYLKFNSEMFSEEISPFEDYSMELYPEVIFDE